jgi:hypothetical protein
MLLGLKNKYNKIIVAVLVCFFMLSPFVAHSSKQIDFSAYILNRENKKISNGEYEISFAIYAADRKDQTDSLGQAVWQETQKVTIKNGVISSYLGLNNPLPANLNFSEGEYYLGIKFGTDSEMVPRKMIGSVPASSDATSLQGHSIGVQEGNIPILGSSGKIENSMIPSITSVGNITSGTWQGSSIADKYISSSGNWNKAYSNQVTSWSAPLSFSSGTASLKYSSNNLKLNSGSLDTIQDISIDATPVFTGLNLSSSLNVSGDVDITGLFKVNGTPISAGAVYTAGAGLQLNGATFSVLSSVMLEGDNISTLTNDSNYITDGNTNWDNSYGFISDGNTNWDNSYNFITASSADTLTNKTWNGNAIGVGYGGTGTSTQFTQGSVVFAGASGLYTQNNSKLFWDNTNNRLGIGTMTPSDGLEIYDGYLRISNDASPATLVLYGDRSDIGDTGQIDGRIAFRQDNQDTSGWNIDAANFTNSGKLRFNYVTGSFINVLTLGNGTVSGMNYVGIGADDPTAFLDVTAPTIDAASFRLEASAGIDPVAPNIGDMWFNGTNLYFRKDGSTSRDLLTSYSSGTGLQLVGTTFSILSSVMLEGDNISTLTNDSNYITDGNTNWDNSYGFITASSADTLTNKTWNGNAIDAMYIGKTYTLAPADDLDIGGNKDNPYILGTNGEDILKIDGTNLTGNAFVVVDSSTEMKAIKITTTVPAYVAFNAVNTSMGSWIITSFNDMEGILISDGKSLTLDGTAGVWSTQSTSSVYTTNVEWSGGADPSDGFETRYTLNSSQYDVVNGISYDVPNNLSVFSAGLKSSFANINVNYDSYAGYFDNQNQNDSIDGVNKYGVYIRSTESFIGGTGIETNNYGLYVDTPTGADNNYAAIFSDGNVGIGTTTPATALQVNNSGWVIDRGTLSLSTVANGVTGMTFYDGSTYGAYISMQGDNNALQLQNYQDGSYGDMELNPLGGSVGIGTTEPLAKLHVGAGTLNNSVDAQILISRNVDDTTAGNGHAFSDSSNISRSGIIGYNSFDNRITITGSNNYDHEVGFQASPTYSSSGSIDRLLGATFAPTITAGTVDKLIGYRVNDAVISGGTVNNFYGLYFGETLDSASNNWAIYSAGDTKSYFGGNVGIGTTGPGAKLEVSQTGAALAAKFTSTYGTLNSANYIASFYNNGVLRSTLRDSGKQAWYLNSDADEVGKIEFQTPGGNPGIAIYTGATYDQNRFNMTNYGTYFGLGYSADNNSTGVLNIKAGGSVGIGTTNPEAKLHVYNATGNVFNYVESDGVDSNVASFYRNDAAAWQVGIAGDNNDALTIGLNGFANDNLVIDTSGNVGIGGTSAGAKLEVKTSASGNSLLINNSAYPGRLGIIGAGTGYTQADILLQTSVTARGTGLYTYDSQGQVTWYQGNPYQTGSGAWALNVKPASATFQNDTAQSNAAGVINTLTVLSSGDVGINSTSPDFKLDISGNMRIEGSNYLYFGGTGVADNDVDLYRSAANQLKTDDQFVAGDGVVNKVNAGACTDAVFTVDTDGLTCIDSANGRIYYRYGGAWHYSAQTAGFQIPNYEAFSYDFNNSEFDAQKPILAGDFLMPFAEKNLDDGAMHGLYAKWSDIKDTLLLDEKNQLTGLAIQTDQNVETISGLKLLIDNQFLKISNDFKRQSDEVYALDNRLMIAENLANVINDQVIELQAQAKIDQSAILGNKTEIDYLETLLGINRVNNPTDISILGKFSAETTETGMVIVKNLDADEKSIGKAMICPGLLEINDKGRCSIEQVDVDEDGLDDKTGNEISHGKKAVVKTTRVNENSRIFLTPKMAIDSSLAVTKISTGEFFEVEIKNAVSSEMEFDWWIVEER